MTAPAGPGGAPAELEAAADHYNFRSHYLEVSTDLRRAFRNGPYRVGDRLPELSLADLDGAPVGLGALAAAGHCTLVFGSYSAPPCQLEMPAIEALHERLGAESTIVFVYVREIHPNEALASGVVVPHHTSMEDKAAWARRLRDELGLTMPVLVDDLQGTVHRLFGALPFSAAVVDAQSLVVFRAEWASAIQLGAVLANLAGRAELGSAGLLRSSYSECLWSVSAAGWH